VQKITPFLWYDGSAEEAAKFYASIFKKSKIGSIRRYGEAGPGPKGSVMSVTFQLEGQEFIALNGGPQKSKRVMQAMLQMKKIDIKGLKEAYGR
jgi:predicted 3-demethylubiquinone-9 3-methyltransferase (glyoxalase superfamily)